MVTYTLVAAAFALSLAQAFAGDPSPLQDFCVADKNSSLFINGLVCKDPKLVSPQDFFFSGLDIAGNTTNNVGSNVTLVNAAALPGLNTLGISVARIDFAVNGLNPPHSHPRATEVLIVLEGTLYVGFVTSNPSRLVAKTLHTGDMFVFPVGLIHFQFNVGGVPAIAITALSSQNPGVITIANVVFGTKLQIPDDVLAEALQVDAEIIDEIKSKFVN